MAISEKIKKKQDEIVKTKERIIVLQTKIAKLQKEIETLESLEIKQFLKEIELPFDELKPFLKELKNKQILPGEGKERED